MQTISIDKNSVNQAIQTTMEYALIRRPAMTDLIRAFVDLFLQKDRCIAYLQNHAVPVDLTACRDRLMSGIPVLTALSLSPWGNHLELACEWMLPSVKQAFPAIGKDVDAIMSANRDGTVWIWYYWQRTIWTAVSTTLSRQPNPLAYPLTRWVLSSETYCLPCWDHLLQQWAWT
ncbi:MAG: hypothetical protein WA151_10565 [Desulfatirhabdiaceae bacterium]